MKTMKAKVLAAVLACWLPAVVHAQSAEAERLYQQTQYQAALAILKQQTQTPAVLFLTGKCWYYAGDFKKAIETFEKAVAADPRSATYQNWLGKAWGRRAENSNVFQAPGFASRAREAFEKAVALDSTHLESLNDLFQYYLEAPGLLGGGLDKARGLLPRIKQADPAEYHSALAQIAEKTKDHTAAETQLRLAASLAPRLAGKAADLARFLARRGRDKEADAAFAEAARRWPDDRGLVFAQAEVYIQGKRNTERARTLLARYLTMPLTPDDPPRQDAEKLLKQAGG
jgi:tetratricopeptide (TPR) repeat protein